MENRKTEGFKEKSSNFKFPISKLKRSILSIISTNLVIAGIISLSGIKAEAAQKIILKYGIFRESISVSELRTFVDTGELSSSLRKYLKKVDGKPDDLRFALKQGMLVDVVLLSKTLNSIPGEFVLNGISQVIHTPSNRGSKESLRSAVVNSALDDNEVQIIEIMENYPTDEIHVDGNSIVETYNTLNKLLEPLAKIGI